MRLIRWKVHPHGSKQYQNMPSQRGTCGRTYQNLWVLPYSGSTIGDKLLGDRQAILAGCRFVLLWSCLPRLFRGGLCCLLSRCPCPGARHAVLTNHLHSPWPLPWPQPRFPSVCFEDAERRRTIGTMSGVPGYGKELKQNKLQGRSDADLSRIEGRLDRLEHTLIDRLERIAAVPRVQAAGPSAAPAAATPASLPPAVPAVPLPASMPPTAVVPAQTPPAGTVPAPMPAAVPPTPVAMTGKGPPATRPASTVVSSTAPGFTRSPLPNSSPTPSRPQAGPPSRPVPAKVDASPTETNMRKAAPTPSSVPPTAPSATAPSAEPEAQLLLFVHRRILAEDVRAPRPGAVRGARASPFAEPTEKANVLRHPGPENSHEYLPAQVCLEGEV